MVFGSVLFASIVMVGLVSVGVALEVDATDSVTRVVDGDTFDTVANGRVRLGDVDARESDEPGFVRIDSQSERDSGASEY
jgi:endonuclease YncB( thermonuclease family)